MNQTLRRLLALATLTVMLLGMLPAANASDKHDHQWSYVIDKAPTCTEDGIAHDICSAPNCPQPESMQKHTISRLGHDWGAWGVNTLASCKTKGVEERVCANDATHKETQEIAIDPLAHNWGAWGVKTPANCTAAGVEERVCANDATHKETREIAIDPLAHNWGAWNVTKAADCTNEGSENRVCARCADTETRAIPALGHAWGDWTVTAAATCTQAGERVHTCSRCQAVEKQVIPPLGKDQPDGHNFGAWTEVVHADCQTEGKEHRACANCSREETRETGKGKHVAKPGWFALPAPTLEKPGRKVRYCEVCGKIIQSQTYGLKGYVYEMPALNFGPRAKTLVTSLAEFRDRFTPLDLSVDREIVYPLVTEDEYYIADLKLQVLNDTLTVTYLMKDPATVVKSELLFLFEDALAVTAADLNDVAASLRYGEAIPLNGRTSLVMDARLLVNYNQEHEGNRPFSDNGVYLDGLSQNAVILQEMFLTLSGEDTPG